MALDDKRELAERIIEDSSRGTLLYSRANDGILHTLTAVEQSSKSPINNWILIFDWNSGQFVSWESISRDPQKAYQCYNNFENQYGESDGFEVVLVGSSDVSMITKTHSHYFGIEGYDSILENLEESISGFSTRKHIPKETRRVLHTLYRKKFWGRNTVSYDTLSNHYCKTVQNLDGALSLLKELGLIEMTNKKGTISLQSSKREEIESYL